jgi:hypothetical protein
MGFPTPRMFVALLHCRVCVRCVPRMLAKLLNTINPIEKPTEPGVIFAVLSQITMESFDGVIDADEDVQKYGSQPATYSSRFDRKSIPWKTVTAALLLFGLGAVRYRLLRAWLGACFIHTHIFLVDFAVLRDNVAAGGQRSRDCHVCAGVDQ